MTGSGVPSSSPGRAPASGVARLVDTADPEGAATTPVDVAERVHKGRFFWLDLEGLGDQELLEFGENLQLSADTIENVAHGTARSWFGPATNSLVAVLPWVTESDPLASENADYLRLVLTDRFLMTVHSTPCEPLRRASTSLSSVAGDDARDYAPRFLFLILDSLVDSFKPQLLAIDDRLGEIQLELLRGGSPAVHDELISTLGVLTDGIQEFGWYSHDLEDIAETLVQLPGMRPDSQQHLEQHRQRITRMRDNAREIREEAKDALSHYSASIANRQAQVINTLTIVATVFLPLSFWTGYLGMNFSSLTSGPQETLWGFILLGVLLPLSSVALSLALIHRLERRLSITSLSEPPG